MVNSNRGPGGRFTSRPVNNSVKVHSRPQSASDNGECSNKKRRLNDGSSQVPIKAPEQQAPKATDPPPPPSTPPSRLSQPARRATPATPSERRTRPVETPSKTEEGRTLRSKDVARPRSELVNFFADFEPIVFGSPKPDDHLSQHTELFVTTEIPRSSSIHKLSNELPVPPSATLAQHFTVGQAQPLANNAISREKLPLNNPRQPAGPIFRKIRLPRKYKPHHWPKHDPLSDQLYEAAHRRGERKEKQSRNWDKERALHEKGELERLLGELRGPDWMKLMGITGVTEADAKKFKPKRDIFIRRAQSMLERYAAWNKRDRELKLEKERRLAEEDEETSSEESENGEESSRTSSETHRTAKQPRRDVKGRERDRKLPTPSVEQKPFTTFFEKPHMREAAMKSYRRGRNVLAFGLPIPDIPEVADFQLPASILGSRQ